MTNPKHGRHVARDDDDPAGRRPTDDPDALVTIDDDDVEAGSEPYPETPDGRQDDGKD